MSDIDNFWKRRRAERDAKARKIITGIDPSKATSSADEHTVRVQIATMLRQLYDAGIDPVVLVQSYLAGAVWLADNSGISRDQLIEAVKLCAMKSDRQLVYTPGGD